MRVGILIICLSASLGALAQSDMSGMHMGDTTLPKPQHGPPMSQSLSLHLPMTRDGSGTSWTPDVSPMNGWMYHSNHWMYMVHGSVSFRYTAQDVFKDGHRGAAKWDGPNWIMGMAQRRVGQQGIFHLNLMMSLDPLTEGGYGYPLLFQTGESWKGIPLVDRQHPHDLFAELSASYAYSISKRSDLSLYLGYPGEPALGPVTFMHRPSAMYDPDAPISHHWQDATHITFGVATLGYRLDAWKLEVSSFTGREPDENRYNFDKPRMDSYSGRLSFAPSPHYSLQVSEGFIKSPEALEPGINVWRTTASVLTGYTMENDRSLDASLVWGMNKNTGELTDHSILAEADYRVRSWAWYLRYEWVQKTADELVLNPNEYNPTDIFGINALTLGLQKAIAGVGPLKLGLGGQVTLNRADARLDPLYGDFPVGAEVFLRIYPRAMHMGHSM